MIRGIVGSDSLKRVPGEFIATVIIDSLDGGASEKPHPLTNRHSSDKIREASTQSVQ